jgi:hypothetical protein
MTNMCLPLFFKDFSILGLDKNSFSSFLQKLAFPFILLRILRSFSFEVFNLN